MYYVQSQVSNKWIDLVSTNNLNSALSIAKNHFPSQVVSRINTDTGIQETVVSSPYCEACH